MREDLPPEFYIPIAGSTLSGITKRCLGAMGFVRLGELMSYSSEELQMIWLELDVADGLFLDEIREHMQLRGMFFKGENTSIPQVIVDRPLIDTALNHRPHDPTMGE